MFDVSSVKEADLTKIRTWAEVDLSALAHNFRTLKMLLKPGTRALAVCKADGYGHGAVPVAKTMQDCGADMLAVACVAEAVELREAGITTPILCLGPSHPNLATLLWKYDIIQTVQDLDNGRAFSAAAMAAGEKIKIHVKCDTGMGRIGFRWPDANAGDAAKREAAAQMADLCRLPGLIPCGMFAHFADADSPEFSRIQIAKFNEAIEAMNVLGVRGPDFVCHTAASIAMQKFPEAHFDMTRFGISLYGYASDSIGNIGSTLNLKPSMTVKSRIAAIRDMPAGATVGYGCSRKLMRDSKIAVIPCGYADAYPRNMSNKGHIRVFGPSGGGMMCPVMGRVCMDMMMVDITDLINVCGPNAIHTWDIVNIIDGDAMPEIAVWADTAIHEILTSITTRVPRVYLN